MTINQGLDYEVTSFGALFSTEDQKEGMYAFVEKEKQNSKADRRLP